MVPLSIGAHCGRSELVQDVQQLFVAAQHRHHVDLEPRSLVQRMEQGSVVPLPSPEEWDRTAARAVEEDEIHRLVAQVGQVWHTFEHAMPSGVALNCR